MDRKDLAAIIVARLEANEPAITVHYAQHRHFLVDDLLPAAVAHDIYRNFPDPKTMMLRSSIRERKYVTSQMDRCPPVVEEAVYAFQDVRVVAAIQRITGLQHIEPDEMLYAGGISVMGRGHYLHPHLDNSHDMERKRYRILNLLYYVSPDWSLDDGGNFELWPDGVNGTPIEIQSKFNRLLVVATDRRSWHSVNRVRTDRARTCVSNYYFSQSSPEGHEYFHVTSFRGRPEHPIRDLLLRGDAALRALARKLSPSGVKKTEHYYKRGR